MLSSLIHKVVEAKLISEIEVGNMCLIISHLQFADDLIVFAKAKAENVINIKRILRIFKVCSRLRLNMKKTSLFGINANNDHVNNWVETIKCRKGDLPTTYLGLPLGSIRNYEAMWEPIIGKFKVTLEDLLTECDCVPIKMASKPIWRLGSCPFISEFVRQPQCWEINEVHRARPPSGEWVAPLIGWCKFNVDAAVWGAFGVAGIGGILRDDEGKPLIIFSKDIGVSNVTVAELKAIYEACCLLFSSSWHDHRTLIIETDSLLAVQWINKRATVPTTFEELVGKCKLFVQQYRCKVDFVFREGNTEAHRLAKEGVNRKANWVWTENELYTKS
ncbi:hypothetical protein GQ457_10G012420 [Hibiscus cannabinus]